MRVATGKRARVDDNSAVARTLKNRRAILANMGDRLAPTPADLQVAVTRLQKLTGKNRTSLYFGRRCELTSAHFTLSSTHRAAQRSIPAAHFPSAVRYLLRQTPQVRRDERSCAAVRRDTSVRGTLPMLRRRQWARCERPMAAVDQAASRPIPVIERPKLLAKELPFAGGRHNGARATSIRHVLALQERQ